MSLSSTKAAAKAEIKLILEEMLTRENNSTEEFANRLVDVIENWLKNATIKYISGLSAPNGPVQGSFNGKLE